METLIVALIVIACVGWVIYRIARFFSRKNPCPGCCANCPAESMSKSAKDDTCPLEDRPDND